MACVYSILLMRYDQHTRKDFEQLVIYYNVNKENVDGFAPWSTFTSLVNQLNSFFADIYLDAFSWKKTYRKNILFLDILSTNAF